MISVRRALVLTLLLALALTTVAGGYATYTITRREIGDALDYQLRMVALSLREQLIALPQPSGPPPQDLELVIQLWNGEGRRVYTSTQVPGLPPAPERAGFDTVTTTAGAWRTYSVGAGNVVLQLVQPEVVRSRLALTAASRSLLPLIASLPILAVLVWWISGRALLPLRRLAGEAARRTAATLDPFPEEGVPAEVRPLVQSLNGLMARLSAALAAQRAFVADAAHELRTPLAALKLQAQLAARAGPEERAQALTDLQAGLDRTAHVVAQLLTLARAEPGGGPPPVRAAVSLPDLVDQVVADHAPLAEAKGIDLGALASDPAAVVRGDPAALRALLANLVDNAIRYTPAHGRVDVAAGAGGDTAFLEVADTGPGIPAADRERVFDRFYRRAGTAEAGSGLGLAIVRAIAERHRGRVVIGEARGGGLLVRAEFPCDAQGGPVTAPPVSG